MICIETGTASSGTGRLGRPYPHRKVRFYKDSIFGCNDSESRRLAIGQDIMHCITHVDHQIGRILTALAETGDYNNTIVLFLADHGELLFDNNFYRKALPYEGSTHIPLLVHVGKNVQNITPFRSDTLTELRDIMPTILDFAGIPIPDSVDGFSLAPEILGEEKNEREFLHGEHSFHSSLSSQFIVTKTDKYIWYSEKK